MGGRGGRLSLFIGRVVDPATQAPSDWATLDPDVLTRHAVCLGMTGSGKTGLCTVLLEELAMAGVPVLLVDPKGDMANLALAFPQNRAEDFAPWVDPAEAKRQGVGVDVLAANTAQKWRDGLATWHVDEARVRAYTDRAKVTIYTPGSTSGTPIDVLSGLLGVPEDADEETLREGSIGAAGALLSLIGHEGDPVTDPAHLLLARLVDDAWRAGRAADPADLVSTLVDPPFQKIGVFPVDQFFPRKDRLALAVQLNGLLASPTFALWTQGAPLDPAALLARGDKTPISVFYLAHLDDHWRMFFVTALLQRVVAWSRRQPGTSALRALVYFDEVFGFLPPHPRNPPAKKPVLTLMKQARAVGVGTMLVTQNPVDVDYAALANAGTWFIGRMQTKQDRAKVVEGLVGAGGEIDEAQIDAWIAQLPARQFVVRVSGSSAPALWTSRQAISFLRGPLTRREIEALRGGDPAPAPVTKGLGPPPPTRASSAPVAAAPVAPEAAVPAGYAARPPPCPEGYTYRWVDPEIAHGARLADCFGAATRAARDDGQIVWEPALYARLWLKFDEGRDFLVERDEHRLFYPLKGDFRAFVEPPFEPGDLGGHPQPGIYAPLPPFLDEAKELKKLEKDVNDAVLRGESEKMYRHRGLKLDSRGGESEADFRARCEAVIEDKIDADVRKLKEKVDREVARFEERRSRLVADAERLKGEARMRQATEVVSAGEALFGMFFGRRSVTTAVSSAMSRRSTSQAAQARSNKNLSEVERLENEIYEVERKTEEEIAEIRGKHLQTLDAIESVDVRLTRSDASLGEFGILWVPTTRAL